MKYPQNPTQRELILLAKTLGVPAKRTGKGHDAPHSHRPTNLWNS